MVIVIIEATINNSIQAAAEMTGTTGNTKYRT